MRRPRRRRTVVASCLPAAKVDQAEVVNELADGLVELGGAEQAYPPARAGRVMGLHDSSPGRVSGFAGSARLLRQ